MSQDLPQYPLRYFVGRVYKCDHFVKYSYHISLNFIKSMGNGIGSLKINPSLIPHSHWFFHLCSSWHILGKNPRESGWIFFPDKLISTYWDNHYTLFTHPFFPVCFVTKCLWLLNNIWTQPFSFNSSLAPGSLSFLPRSLISWPLHLQSPKALNVLRTSHRIWAFY